MSGLGYERIKQLAGSTFKDSSTVVLIPTRGMVHYKFVQGYKNLISPMNQKRFDLWNAGDEVGFSYDKMVKFVLDHPELSRWKYILTLEDDMIVPADAHVRLLESIEHFACDAVSAIYFTKGPINMPMAYGDPAVNRIEFAPRDIRVALAQGQFMRVNGIAMGCALWRISSFKKLDPPWFKTVADVTPNGAVEMFTQDLWFCRKALAAGWSFGVDMRVRCGHLDVNTGEVY
jgi:hypothetical protein